MTEKELKALCLRRGVTYVPRQRRGKERRAGAKAAARKKLDREHARWPDQHMLLFALHLEELGLRYQREWRFHEQRQWEMDFAIPALRLAIEIEGGGWTAGRHVRGAGFANDLEKYQAAFVLGWNVVRFSVDDVLAGRAKAVLAEWLARHEAAAGASAA